MIVLDTNVISELMRDRAHESVLAWLDEQAGNSLFVTAVSEAEIRYGLAVLPPGSRRCKLIEAAGRAFGELLRGRVLSFDSEAAEAYAAIAAERRGAGKAISQFDCQIAAIVRVRGAILATRNLRDFEGCGIGIVDPWSGRRSTG